MPGHYPVHHWTVEILQLAKTGQDRSEYSRAVRVLDMTLQLDTESLQGVMVFIGELVQGKETVRDLLDVQHVLVLGQVEGEGLQQGNIAPLLPTQLC